ncbi:MULTISPECIES: tRNA (guanosine(46)-N7)-methyltransferase TrmB [Oceanobacillus]|uniref:tRNA (guanine-N(7)-)-methyltransferase n=1 Tax=Oceanobacillus kimchii TaxID=746691 RepID=A0ABQ5TKW1_9BACI|nr:MULTISPECIES: tRNA (guanosine(46)-N7)-methyltransferase TrmB [Oceanobacillus]MBT2600705.1 tRNA (guanosine(46)-N7)-methyltransferase TrmB [Oceanobacillus sp. ISL-74]MBT2650898.1 tRNA (guanosine(46)-N7)-methyltransferase TrmB [Oceanobacillus sp. ISL-73]MCT1575460.1 tRNA (guanosine(46)-N7)-methyltransferase TrmB [Oceanobacillus kimchii]MCT2138033.1 tRNA (guanosine(46)-N7)-methyltransferase TrmB [Oceanobacillus kimchii]OEH55278.1 tRNA (guanine-N7)-methyltransferase [Oceanobacillus sp. E9]
MRQRNKPWADEYLQEKNHIVINDPKSNKGNWNQLFNNNNPIHVEIGSGKGQFILGMAKQHPDINFIGIELAKSIIVSAVQKIDKESLANVFMLNENAIDVREMFADDEISMIYLNFSDPWPKNRHEKRRLTYERFLNQYQDILCTNGEVILKTDNRGLFEYSVVSFSQYGMNIKELNVDLHAIEDETNVMTEYEEKFSAKGQPIYRCKAVFEK